MNYSPEKNYCDGFIEGLEDARTLIRSIIDIMRKDISAEPELAKLADIIIKPLEALEQGITTKAEYGRKMVQDAMKGLDS